MARSDFTEMKLHFYMHRIHDFELIDHVKSLKQSRKLNSLIIKLLKRYISEERAKLLNAIESQKESLGFLPELSDIDYKPKDVIDMVDINKRFLAIDAEFNALKNLLALDNT